MEDLVLSCLESRVEANRNLYTRFLVGPFLKGDALTVATALRRVLLSSVESIGITALYIQGITHEFSIIAGVRESVLELSLNFQAIVLCYDKSFLKKKNFFDDIQIGYLQVQGPKVVYANDLKLPLGIKLVDPTQYIATVSKEGSIVLKFIIGKKNNFLRSEARTVPCRAPEGPKGGTKSSFASTKEGQKRDPSLLSPCPSFVEATLLGVSTTRNLLLTLRSKKGKQSKVLLSGAPKRPFLKSAAKPSFFKKQAKASLFREHREIFPSFASKDHGKVRHWKSPHPRSKVRQCNNLYKAKFKMCKEVKQQNISIYTPEPDSVFSMKSLSPLGERFDSQMPLRGSFFSKSFGKHKKESIYFPFLGQLAKKNITRAKKGYLYKESSTINRFRTKTWLANKAKLPFFKKQSFGALLTDTPFPPLLGFAKQSSKAGLLRRSEAYASPKGRKEEKKVCMSSFTSPSLLCFAEGVQSKESQVRRGAPKQRTDMHNISPQKQGFSGQVDRRGIKDDVKRRFIALPSNKKKIKTKDCIQAFSATIGTPVQQLKFNCFKSSKDSTFLSKNKVFKSDICLRNIIPLDLTLTPVLKVNFVIEIDDDVLYLRQKVRERIILEVWTNGSIHPRQALHDAALSLTDMFASFRSVYQVQSTFLPLFKINQFNKTCCTRALLSKKQSFQSYPFGCAHAPYGNVKRTTKPLVKQKASGIKSFRAHTWPNPRKGVRQNMGNQIALRGSFFTKSFGNKKLPGAPPLHITDVHVCATQRSKKGVERSSTNLGEGTARPATHDEAKALSKKKINNNFVYKTKLERNSLFFSDMGSLALPVNIYSFLKKKGIKKFLTLNNLSSFDLLLLLKGNTEMFYTVKRCLSKINFSYLPRLTQKGK